MQRRYISEVLLKEPVDPASYLAAIPAVRHLITAHSLPIPSEVTILVGENGAGKSTLIEAIAVAYGFNAEGGSRNFNFSTAATHSDLWQHLILARQDFPRDGFFLRAESYYNVATNIDEMASFDPQFIESYGGVSPHDQSHGESFLSLVQNRFFGDGLYILDEPEAALSPSRLLTLMAEMARLIEKRSQFIIATHSPMLMAFPGACVYQITDTGIQQVDYRKTEHYQITRSFLENPEKLLNLLLDPS